MDKIDFKELNRLRSLRCKTNHTTKKYFINNPKDIFRIVENPGFLFRSCWNERQNSLLKYLLENQSKFKDKNVLIMFDGVGFCGVIANLLGSNVTICEEEEYWSLIETNIKSHMEGKIENSERPESRENFVFNPKLITPIEYEKDTNSIYDYIIVSETIYSKTILEKIFVSLSKVNKDNTKIIVGIRKDFWETEKFLSKESPDIQQFNILSYFPKDYTWKQITPMKSNQNVIFELEKKRTSWLL